MKNKVIIIAGMSGSGKDTLIDSILDNSNKYSKIVSVTTRDKRIGEIEGKSYKFISKEEFNKRFKKGDYFQYSKFAGNSYAYEKKELLKIIKEKNVLLICHPQAIMLVTFFLEQCEIDYKTIYLDIMKEVGNKRMNHRGDSKENIAKRDNEMMEFVWYKNKADFVINANGTIQESYNIFKQIEKML